MAHIRRFSLWMASSSVLATPVLLLLGNGMNPIWELMWVAPIPILLFAASSASWRLAGSAAALSMFLGSLTMLYYLHFVLHGPVVVWLVPFSAASLFFAAAVLLYRALLRRKCVVAAVVSLPAMWVVCEYLASLAPANGTAGSLAYTQLRFLPFAQLASITGPWGITFVLLLFPGGAAAAGFLWAASRPQAARVIWLVALVTTAVLLFGSIRLRSSQAAEVIRVGLLATDSIELATGPAMRSLVAGYGTEAERLAQRGAHIIVMPEKVGVLDPTTVEAVDSTLQSVSDRNGAVLVIGVVDAMASASLNQARIYTPHQEVASYSKQHLLAPFESRMIPGSSQTFISLHSKPIGVAICKDMDFVQPAADYGHLGAALMLDPAWDFGIDRTWHGHIAIMRGIENGYSIVHTAKQGFLTATDDRGRVLGEIRSDSATFSSLLVSVPLRHDETFFNRCGTWFPWFSALLLIATILRLFSFTGTINSSV